MKLSGSIIKIAIYILVGDMLANDGIVDDTDDILDHDDVDDDSAVS